MLAAPLAVTLFALTALSLCVFFFTDTATTEIYTLSLHDALPILTGLRAVAPRIASGPRMRRAAATGRSSAPTCPHAIRSEEHTSELQSHSDLVCRLLLEKKKTTKDSYRLREP